MNSTVAHPSEIAAPEKTASRIVSVDIFRGLTMAVMIFVNELSSVRGLPWWTYHAPARADEMTYVDMVFPFFLFIVGISLPLSIAQRLKRNPSLLSLWKHVALRVLGLLVLGLILANAEKFDSVRIGFGGSTWALLGLISAVLYLNDYGNSERFRPYARWFRFAGFAGVLILLAIFRRTASGHNRWIDFSYPEILGLIGLSYLAVAILFIPTRRWAWAPPVWLALLITLCVLSASKTIAFPQYLPLYVWPFGNGAMSSVIMAGVIVGSLFAGCQSKRELAWTVTIAICFGLLMLAAGWVLTPLGISKIRATPTWSLYSIGAGILIFTLVYWICDVKKWTRWALFVHPAGSNTLLTYLVPDLWYFLLGSIGITWLDTHFSMGWPGVVKAFIFTFFVLGVAAALTKAKVRLQF
jgi:heparan-alpha-glucosaminide N-acetyltransferase